LVLGIFRKVEALAGFLLARCRAVMAPFSPASPDIVECFPALYGDSYK